MWKLSLVSVVSALQADNSALTPDTEEARPATLPTTNTTTSAEQATIEQQRDLNENIIANRDGGILGSFFSFFGSGTDADLNERIGELNLADEDDDDTNAETEVVDAEDVPEEAQADRNVEDVVLENATPPPNGQDDNDDDYYDLSDDIVRLVVESQDDDGDGDGDGDETAAVKTAVVSNEAEQQQRPSSFDAILDEQQFETKYGIGRILPHTQEREDSWNHLAAAAAASSSNN